MTALTDAYENKRIDFEFRGQAFGTANATAAAGTGPATWYVGLKTAADTDSTPGAEVSGGSYARVPVVSSLANWAGTQGAGTTVASSGTSATTSNNVSVTFAAPTAAWGQIVGAGLFDSLTGGTECWFAALTTPKTINSGDAAPTFPPGSLSFTVDTN